MVNPANAIVAETTTNELRETAGAIGLEVKILKASSNREIDAAFFSLIQQRVGALLVSADPYFTSRRVQCATLAARTGIPVMYSIREYVEVGGLMSYGYNIAEAWRRVGVYAGRILKGEKDLPVEQSTLFGNRELKKINGLLITYERKGLQGKQRGSKLRSLHIQRFLRPLARYAVNVIAPSEAAALR